MNAQIFYNILLIFVTFSYAIIKHDIYDNSWALVIGIDKYQKAPILSYAVNDAQSIQSMLIKSFNYPPENTVLLTNDLATKDNILEELSKLTEKAKSNDRVLIFFAGHGQTKQLPNGGELGYLLPFEGDSDNLYLSSIGMDELEKVSIMSNSKHLLFLVDVCYGGVAADGFRSLNKEKTPNYINKIIKNKARQIITAGGRGEQVIEKSEWGHSAFTKNILSGLKDWRADSDDDGYITADELGSYLRRQVTIDSDNLQTPVKRRFGSDEGEFIFYKKQEIDDFEEDYSEEDDQIINLLRKTLNNFDVSFYLGNFNQELLELSVQMYSPTKNISGFQFSVTGAEIAEITGGIAQEAGFTMNSSPNSIGGFSMASGYILSSENRIRPLVTFSLNRAAKMICLDGIIFLDENGSILSTDSSDCLFTK